MNIRTSVSFFLPALAFSLVAGTAQAGERQHAVAGAIIGGAAGALIGHEFSGRDGALVGGALGAATGVAVATAGRNDRDDDRGYREAVRERADYRRDDYYPVHERVVYREAPVLRERVVYREAPVVVYRPVAYAPVRQVVTYAPVRYVDRDRRDWKQGRHPGRWDRHPGRGHGRGHGHGHDD